MRLISLTITNDHSREQLGKTGGELADCLKLCGCRER